MPHDDQLFTPDEVDEQIAWLERASRVQPPTPNTRVIQGLHRLYDNEQSDAHSVDAVWQRLLERGAVPALQPERARRSGPPRRQRDSGPPPQAYAPAAPARRGLSTRLLAISAAALLVVVVSGLVAAIILVRQHGPVVANQATATPGQQPGQTAQPTQPPQPHPPEVAYIGSDKNVWLMIWPGGTPKQLTTDAKYGDSFFSGLAWSPDGSLLAVAKGTFDKASIVILKPDGTLVVSIPLSGQQRVNTIPFAWSPDSTMIAYRAPGDSETFLPDGAYNGKLVLVDAHTGKTVKSVTYEAGGSGCGGGGPFAPLGQALWTVHHSDFGRSVDLFAWSPDGRSMLVAGNCNPNGPVAQVDLSTSVTRNHYPFYGSYQPGGNLILGYWNDGTLGLTDLAGNHIRALVKSEPYVNPPQYIIRLGLATWTNDGQTIYYEHDDGIGRVGVDGSNPRQVVAGTALDSQDNATVQLVPSASPDGKMLLYLQVRGSNRAVDTGDPTPQPTPTIPLTTQWYVAQADGNNPVPLPQGISNVVWRPGK